MIELANGILELGLGDVLQDPLSVPSQVEHLGFGTGKNCQFFSVDLVVFQSDVATGGDVDPGSFGDLDLGLGGTAGWGRQKIFEGVDQIFFPAQFEDSIVGGLNLEIAVPGGGLRIFDLESPQTRFAKVGLEHLTSFAVVHLGQFETVLQLTR